MTEIQIQFDVPAEMRDGTVLRADVYRPEGAGPWPVLLSRLPYGKQMPLLATMLDPLAAARRGFMVVIQDTRGRFASEGEWDPFTYEESDGYDTVRWAAALPGSNGSVGMIGGSYFGNTQWMAALAKPPELKAIAPVITWSDPEDGLWTRGGAIELGISAPWSLMMGADLLMRRHAADLEGLVGGITGLVRDLDGLAGGGYAELPAGRFPAFARNDLPERVLVFTAFPEHASVASTLAAGACGLLVKDANGATVRDAVRSVVRTGSYQTAHTATSVSPVTAREYDVLRLVAAGHTNLEIGAELNLSVNTVKTYLREVMRKLGARNRAQVIMRARSRGLL